MTATTAYKDRRIRTDEQRDSHRSSYSFPHPKRTFLLAALFVGLSLLPTFPLSAQTDGPGAREIPSGTVENAPGAPENADGPTPATGPPAPDEETPPRTIGLALAGGGALGFAHLGVILELEALGVPVHYVGGTSMGSIVGALYATGYTGQQMLDLLTETNWSALFSDAPPRRGQSYEERRADTAYLVNLGFREGTLAFRSGASTGQNVVELLDQLMTAYAVSGSFDRFPRPLRVVATDLVSGEEVVFEGGDLKSAIRASMAVPGIFTPTEYDGRILIDGGWVNVLPVDAVRSMGADYVIAVNLNTLDVTEEELDSLPAVVNQASAILRRPRLEQNLQAADLVIEPEVSRFSVASFEQAVALIEEGRVAARAVIPELVSLSGTGKELDFDPSLLSPSRDRLVDIWRVAYRGARPEPEVRLEIVRSLVGDSWVSSIQETVEELYATGRYEYVSYALEEEREGMALEFQLVPVEEARTTLRGGYTFRSEPFSDSSPRFLLRSNLTVDGLSGPGSRWSTDLRVADASTLRTEYEQPVLEPLSLVASLFLESQPLLYYEDRRVESYYLRRGYGGALGVRGQLFEAIQVTALGVAEWLEATLREGSDRGLETGEGKLGFSVRGVVDSYDQYPFPRRGNESIGSYDYRFQPTTGVVYNVARLRQQHYVPLLRESAFGLGYTVATDFDSGAPPYERSFLGGFGSLSGLHDQELIGRHSAVFSAELRLRVFALPLGAGDNVYLSLRSDLGNVWDRPLVEIPDKPELVAGGSLGLSADTVFGQVHLHFALAAGPGLGANPLRYTTYLLLGNLADAPLLAAYR